MAEVSVLDTAASELVGLLSAAGIASRGFTDPDRLRAEASGTEILLARPDTAAGLIDGLPGLRWVQSTWAGVEPLVDAGIPDGVVVTGVRGVFGPQMREFVLGHLLGHTQRVARRALARRWDPDPPSLLAGSTMGILGTGSIGQAIAATARHLGMTVRGCNRTGRAVDPFHEVFAVSDRLAFAGGLDHLVAVLPATSATHRLVDGRLLSRLSRGATFVNVGRGTTADLAAVVDALAGGRLALAVLDVLPVEPLPDDDPLWDVEGLVITSHTAAWSRPVDIASVFVRNHHRYLAGEPLENVVDPRRGY